jgi:hypothetical protein
MENKVYVRCLQKDVPQVKSVLSECASEYKKIIKAELGEDIHVDLSIDEERYLQERIVPDFTALRYEDLTAEHERQIKIDRSVDSQRWYECDHQLWRRCFDQPLERHHVQEHSGYPSPAELRRFAA